MKTILYRYFNSNGVLIYVGVTGNMDNRHKQHKYSSHWFSKASSRSVKKYTSREEALAAEKEAIKSEEPLFNIEGNLKEVPESEYVSKYFLVNRLNPENKGSVCISKGAANLLPTERPFTDLEAKFCLLCDYSNGSRYSFNSYAKLWRWGRKRTTSFVKANLIDTGVGR